MIVCGLQINHGSSACIFDNENIIWYNEESRLTKDKKGEVYLFYVLIKYQN